MNGHSFWAPCQTPAPSLEMYSGGSVLSVADRVPCSPAALLLRPAGQDGLALEERDAQEDEHDPGGDHGEAEQEEERRRDEEGAGDLARQPQDEPDAHEHRYLLRAARIGDARRHRDRRLQPRERGERPQHADEEQAPRRGERPQDARRCEQRDHRDIQAQPDRLDDQRRQERGEHLRDQDLRRRERRRQQRLERPSLLFADDRIRGERDGPDDRGDEVQQQELLKEEDLRRGLERQRGQRRCLRAGDREDLPKRLVRRQRLARAPREDDDDQKRQDGADDDEQDDG